MRDGTDASKQRRGVCVVDVVEESGVLELERVVLVMVPGLEWYSALVGMAFPLIPEAEAADGRKRRVTESAKKVLRLL
jgi:hypothetical protein